MKILITTDLYTTATNGVVTSVRNLYDVLKHKGHDVRILTLSDKMNSYRDGDVYYIRSVSLEVVYPNVRMPMTYHHPLIDELIEWRPDVIHSQCEFSVSSLLSASPSTPTRRLSTPITHCVVPSGIDLAQHHQRITAEQRREKREALGIAEGMIVLISLGRLGTEKSLDELINRFAAAVKMRDDIVLLIVGDGPARAELEKQAKELGIANRVIFTGMVPPEKVHEYYQLGDIFVSASTSETQGLTYVEAAANRLPLLCKQDLCLRNVLLPGENGYEFTNEEEFLDGVNKLADDPVLRASAGHRSEEIAASFDKKAFGEAIEEIYQSARINCENMQH